MIQQQILRLQVAIDNVHRMHVLEREHHAAGVELRGRLVERGALAQQRELTNETERDERERAERADREIA